MIEIQTTEDFYLALDALIVDLKAADQTQLSNILHYRVHNVAWTTRSELFEELQGVLTKALKSNELKLSKILKDHISQVLLFINK
jgi:hypothetical protein